MVTCLVNKSNIILEQVNHISSKMQHLFSNDLISYRAKVIFFSKWRSKGIETIKDVIHHAEKHLLS